MKISPLDLHFSFEEQKTIIKTSTGKGSHLSSFSSGLSKRLPKYYRLLQFPLVEGKVEGKFLMLKVPCT